MEINVTNPIWIYPFGNAYPQVIEALRLIRTKCRESGIDFNFKVSKSARLILRSGNHVNARGWFSGGGNIWLHSGQNPRNPNDYQAPFKAIDPMARVLCHEWMHAAGRGHRSKGVMHPHANAWFDKTDEQWIRVRYGDYVKTAPKKSEMQILREKIAELKAERADINKEIARLATRIRQIKAAKAKK